MSAPVSDPVAAGKSMRLLACVTCQQRKVKCDRKQPCTNCAKSAVQCVPAALAPRQKRRRFPEKELLDRIRRYESILRRHGISFDPLHPSSTARPSTTPEGAQPRPTPAATDSAQQIDDDGESALTYRPKNFWTTYNEKSGHSEDDNDSDDDDDNRLHPGVVYKAWDEIHQDKDLLFFGSSTAVDLLSLHPQQMHIFKIWQIYIDNVNPLLKVTHTPTLQIRVLEAASSLAEISSEFEALLFAIYSIAVASLKEDDCLTIFGMPKHHLLTTYRSGCRQALQKCEVLRSDDLECLTALYLYLISVREDTDPRSLSSILAIAMRNAQRIGIHAESLNIACPPFEAEMRRRLWWSLVVFDARICELVQNKSTLLVPTWDCKIPSNVNDFDIRPEMKTAPKANDSPTDAIFTVVRSRMSDHVRRSAAYLDFTNPQLKALTTRALSCSIGEVDEIDRLEAMLQTTFLRLCDPENPLHCMTVWMHRGWLAKCHLLQYYSKLSKTSQPPTPAERNAYISYAVDMLDCDTKLMTSILTKGYTWLVHCYMPMPAYLYIIQEWKERPVMEHMEKSWDAMSRNYAARIMDLGSYSNPIFKGFSNLVLRAWESCEKAFRQTNKQFSTPSMIVDIKEQKRQSKSDSSCGSTGLSPTTDNTAPQSPSMFLATDIGRYGFGMDYWNAGSLESMDYSNLLEQPIIDSKLGQLDWNMLDWQTDKTA